MKAIILAAGVGSRMKNLTDSIPKCLLKLNDKSIIEHQVMLLNKMGVCDIDIITGYKSDEIQKKLKDKVKYHFYPDFHNTNNLYTLNYHSHLLDNNVLIIFSDLLIHPKILESAINNNDDFLFVVDTSKCDESTMRIQIKKNQIFNIGSHIPVEKGDGNFIGLAKLSSDGSKLLKQKLNSIVNKGIYKNDYYTMAIADMASEGEKINFVDVDNKPWLEIDTSEEYMVAKKTDFYLVK